MVSPGVQLRPSLMPPSHLLLGPQIGQGWMKVVHEPPGQPALPVQFAPALEPPLHRIVMRSESRKSAELSGRLSAVTEPAEQSAVPLPLAVMVLMTQVLVAALLCAALGMGSGGP